MTRLFLKGSHYAVLGFDITSKDSFNEIKEYHYNLVKDMLNDDKLIYLVANKIDALKYQVTENESIFYAKEKNIKYFRVSAKTGEGVNDLFENIANSLIQ